MKRGELRNALANAINKIDSADYDDARSVLGRILADVGLKGRARLPRKFYIIRIWPENDAQTVIGPFTKKRTTVEIKSWEGKGFDVTVIGATASVDAQIEHWMRGREFDDQNVIEDATIHDLSTLETKKREPKTAATTKKAARKPRDKK